MAMTHEARISKIFRDAFQAHPARQSDPALALESARETASAAVLGGVTGRFDDERLTFTENVTDEQIRALGAEAGEHGDLEQVAICERAIRGDETARKECARVIADARAQR